MNEAWSFQILAKCGLCLSHFLGERETGDLFRIKKFEIWHVWHGELDVSLLLARTLTFINSSENKPCLQLCSFLPWRTGFGGGEYIAWLETFDVIFKCTCKTEWWHVGVHTQNIYKSLCGCLGFTVAIKYCLAFPSKLLGLSNYYEKEGNTKV